MSGENLLLWNKQGENDNNNLVKKIKNKILIFFLKNWRLIN